MIYTFDKNFDDAWELLNILNESVMDTKNINNIADLFRFFKDTQSAVALLNFIGYDLNISKSLKGAYYQFRCVKCGKIFSIRGQDIEKRLSTLYHRLLVDYNLTDIFNNKNTTDINKIIEQIAKLRPYWCICNNCLSVKSNELDLTSTDDSTIKLDQATNTTILAHYINNKVIKATLTDTKLDLDLLVRSPTVKKIIESLYKQLGDEIIQLQSRQSDNLREAGLNKKTIIFKLHDILPFFEKNQISFYNLTILFKFLTNLFSKTNENITELPLIFEDTLYNVMRRYQTMYTYYKQDDKVILDKATFWYPPYPNNKYEYIIYSTLKDKLQDNNLFKLLYIYSVFSEYGQYHIKNHLHFDCYLTDNPKLSEATIKIAIEFDGWHTHYDDEHTKLLDIQKNNFCKKNNIALIRFRWNKQPSNNCEYIFSTEELLQSDLWIDLVEKILNNLLTDKNKSI